MRIKAILPQYSSFVSASAGSGKTKILIDRLVNLLLNEVKPNKILCLAFTKASAAEIFSRIKQRLADFAICSEDQLINNLEELGFTEITSEIKQRARILFAEFLDETEPLNIQTIHSFAQRLLMRFPFEAGINFNFSLLNENQVIAYIEQAKNILLNSVDNYDLARNAITYLSWHIKEYTLNELLIEIVNSREKLDNYFDIHQNLDRHLEDEINEEDIINSFISGIALNVKLLEKLYNGSKIDIKRADSLVKFILLPIDAKLIMVEKYLVCFLTQTGDMLKSIITKKLGECEPNLKKLLEKEQQRVYEFSQNLKLVKAKNLTRNFLILSYHIRNIYSQLKRKSNSLDYDDLINLTNKLLNNSEYSDWISYKLDGGIDHLLLDEAQDTSSAQWQIINKITEEFFYQHDKPRSFFIVGDAKQSIFSFQGADPKLFNQMNDYLPSEVIRVSLNKSYRSGSKILQLVDKIFNNPDIKSLVTSIDPFIKHIAHKDIEGKVEIWPLIIDKEAKEDTPWSMPSDFIHSDSLTAQDILAKNIAEYIERQVIDPGDILILTRRRTGFVNTIISELKLRNIPVNGLDRITLIEHKAILDLVALINVILYPLDDFNLAIVLKSPIFGITEEELLNLCYNRSASLWESLQNKKILEELIELSKEKTLFEFFFDILEYRDIRPKFEREFGIEVNDVLDSFLDLVVQFETENIPCLQLFLDYLNSNKSEVKRDLSHSTGQVRIMTVHGAKGLQAKTVILADTTSLPHNFDSIIWLNDNNLVWTGREKYYSKSSIEAKANNIANEYAEYIRLLYVALTRAEENIIVCGTCKTVEAPKRSWYHIVNNALSENDDTKTKL